MNITIDLAPEEERRLRLEASNRGLAVEDLIRELIGRALETERAADEAAADWDALAEEIGRIWPKDTPVLDVLSEMRR